jgi:acetyl esterase/lipase
VRKFVLFVFIVSAYRVHAQVVIPLYQDSIPNSIGKLSEADKPTITIYRPTKETITNSAIIIFPGGAYQFHAINEEGYMIAKAFSEKGLTAFVVKYRLPSDQTMRDKSIGPLQDVQQAIRYVRMHRNDYGIDSNKIGIIGFSAGGHVASTLGTHFSTSHIPNKEGINLRPDIMILVYPVISMDNSITHRGSRISLLGNGPSMAKVIEFSNEEQVSSETPPTYLTHCGDDEVVSVHNSLAFYEACLKKNVPVEMHLFPKGNHGFTQRLPVSEWLNPILFFMKKQGFY